MEFQEAVNKVVHEKLREWEIKPCGDDDNGKGRTRNRRLIRGTDDGIQTEVKVIREIANAPNPFNPSTTITYTLGSDAQVSLTIFDMQGRTVKSLVNASQTAGSHAAVWDGTNEAGVQVPSGSYIYQVSTGSEVETKLMLLTK